MIEYLLKKFRIIKEVELIKVLINYALKIIQRLSRLQEVKKQTEFADLTCKVKILKFFFRTLYSFTKYSKLHWSVYQLDFFSVNSIFV